MPALFADSELAQGVGKLFVAGLVLVDEPAKSIYPTPLACEDKDEVFVGRLRIDPSVDNGFNMWIVSDNLLKGAAWNSVQIAESLIKLSLVK